MAKLNVTTKTAEQVWSSPDGKLTIFKLGLEYEGKPFAAKTYSKTIATPGWSGEIESYEKQGRNGSETFVKQPQKEGSFGGRSFGSKPQSNDFTMYLSYAKDLAIACVVATPKGVVFDSNSYTELLSAVEAGGTQLYSSRVSAEPKTETDNVKAVFPDAEEVPTISIDEINDSAELPL